MDLITKIRKNSATLHSAAERSGFIKRIVDGNASKDSYAEYLFNLSTMYNSIEQALERNIDNDTVKEFATPELYRYDLIKKDLDFLLDKINELEKTNPELVIAYAYTRFIADLFGGRTFVALLSVNYKVPAEGLNYYSCDKIKDIRAYVMNYANKLNNLNLPSDLETKFINEISNAYIYNLAISNELEAKLYLN